MATEGKITPGINPRTKLDHFDKDEMSIIEKFKSELYITRGGGTVKIHTSTYKYFFIKPTEIYQQLFNLEREIVVVFSNYAKFEPRTLDAVDYAYKSLPSLRIEKICSIIISKDPKIESKLKDLLKSEPEMQIAIPFFFDEISKNVNPFYIRNKFKDNFFSRDLFAFQSPLKKDLYFFGRADFIHTIVNRHRSNENSGLFGLRKTGKTSLIFGIQRAISKQNGISIFIDCQNTSFNQKRWYRALFYIIQEIREQFSIIGKFNPEDKYTEENSANAFEKDIQKISKKLNDKNILIIFDEIEQITYKLSPVEHWRKGFDFIFFWQSLRSIFQKLDNIFSYLIVGTNPMCVEMPLIEGHDNPIFNQIPYNYIPPFDVPQTREMVRKLGHIIGLQFDEIIYSKLTEDFGGHPFLIRNVCSAINKIVPEERPVRIDKTVYDKGKELFNREYTNYIKMILSVLTEYYNDEYEMLKFLALGDTQNFYAFAKLSEEYTNHLLGYNIIDHNQGSYSFKIESAKDFLVNSHKYQKLNLTGSEMLLEISERRNEVEPKVRTIVRTILHSNFGNNEAKKIVLDIYGDPRKSKYYSFNYKDIFDSNKSEVYFEDMKKIILSNWNKFEHIFNRDRRIFEQNCEIINKYRADAHAKNITINEMELFRVAITKLENQIDEYL